MPDIGRGRDRRRPRRLSGLREPGAGDIWGEVPKPRFFTTPAQFRAWLEANHDQARELWVGYYNARASRSGITWVESVEEALCYGWIDGVRRSLDDTRYAIRFTPRKPKSKWSAVNVRHVTRLKAAGRMRPPGLAAFERRSGEAAGYSYETRPHTLDPSDERRFRANRKAWAYFTARTPSYRRTAASWVASAKKRETRDRRLATLIACSANGEPIPALRRPTGK